MTDIVVISLEAWDEVWRRNQHLIAGLLRADPSLRVLFVEPALDPLHAAASRRRPRPGRGLRPGPRLDGVGRGRLWRYEPTKWLPRRLDRGVDRRWASCVARAAAEVGMGGPVLWVNSPSGAHVLTRTGWPALYDVTDDWLAADRTPAEIDRLRDEESLLLRRCEEVVVCSPALRQRKHAPRVTLIPNAVDLAPYRTRGPRPPDLPSGTIALYAGTVHADRLDVPLSVELAEALGVDATLVMLGPDLLSDKQRLCLTEAGVHLLGPRAHEAVPAYLQHADVLVVPHVVSSFTDSLDPIKVYEYAAAGRPVVSTPVAGFRDSGRSDVVVASGRGFVDAVLRASTAATPPRPPPPDVPTWEQRVDQMSAVIARVAAR